MGRLAPSGRAFLAELSLVAENAAAAAAVLRERLESASECDGQRAELATYAREADALAARVTTGVPDAMMPPIDGEDATELASRLRVVVKGMHRLGRLADVVRPSLPDATVVLLADLLVQATDSVEGAAATMTQRSSALDFAADVRRVAREGDRAYAEAVGALLAAGSNPLDVVRQAAIYGALRDSLCDCRAAVAVIERVVLKRF